MLLPHFLCVFCQLLQKYRKRIKHISKLDNLNFAVLFIMKGAHCFLCAKCPKLIYLPLSLHDDK